LVYKGVWLHSRHAHPLRSMFSLATVSFLVLLSTTGHASMCPDNNGMSDEVRQAFLDKHNAYRTLVAKGEAQNGIGGNAPKAARMLKMKYDCAIEENTMNFAKKCVFAHNSYADRNYWGQNLYMSSVLKQNKTVAAAEVRKSKICSNSGEKLFLLFLFKSVDLWFDELKQHGVPDDNVMTMAVFNRGVGHYTQVIWRSVKGDDS
uniref:SCP domain-containing protein n=1 Tax=Haemonchus placei TaxID=6290 RepID=A0A0N4WTQ2_HAEPC